MLGFRWFWTMFRCTWRYAIFNGYNRKKIFMWYISKWYRYMLGTKNIGLWRCVTHIMFLLCYSSHNVLTYFRLPGLGCRSYAIFVYIADFYWDITLFLLFFHSFFYVTEKVDTNHLEIINGHKYQVDICIIAVLQVLEMLSVGDKILENKQQYQMVLSLLCKPSEQVWF